jgi:PhnB protein
VEEGLGKPRVSQKSLSGRFCYTLFMTTINPWINFNGNAEEAFNFYKSVFGGEFTKVIRFKDLASAEFPVPESEMNKIMQITLPLSPTSMLIGNDVPEFMGKVNENENRSKIHLGADTREDAERIFTGLSTGGTVEGPIGDSPWGTYAGMFRDKYGIEWIIEFNLN